ncbi:MAG: class IV adenylate cyclase [Candidatus Bathyarchaeia archaeon]|jgi:adenylate cyclase class 2
MDEIEAKILEVDQNQVRSTLAMLGAKKVFDDEMETLFFDFETNSIANAKNVLRLRREGHQVVLTFKNVLSNQAAKIAHEYSVEVSSLDDARKILECLGLHVVESMQKHRVSYQLGEVHFDLDCYKGDYSFIPEFLEIEAPNIELIHKYAQTLGFSPKDCLPWSTLDLINHYSKGK